MPNACSSTSAPARVTVTVQRQWVPSRPKFLVHVHPLADHYRTLFRQGLQRDAPDLLKTLPARVWKQRWVVHCQPAGSGEAALRYLSRYVFKTSTSPSAQRAGKRPDQTRDP